MLLIYLAFKKPQALKIPNMLWTKLGLHLGNIVGSIIMGLIYVFIFSSINVITRSFGIRILNVKPEKTKTTYWLTRESPPERMESQF